jgi:hypothetical protein
LEYRLDLPPRIDDHPSMINKETAMTKTLTTEELKTMIEKASLALCPPGTPDAARAWIRLYLTMKVETLPGQQGLRLLQNLIEGQQ